MHELYDRAALEAYWAAVRSTLAGFSAQMLSSYREFDLVEGEMPIAAVVLVEFDTIGEARAWYASPAYRAAKALRSRAGRFTGLIVDGGITPAEARRLVEVPRP